MTCFFEAHGSLSDAVMLEVPANVFLFQSDQTDILPPKKKKHSRIPEITKNFTGITYTDTLVAPGSLLRVQKGGKFEDLYLYGQHSLLFSPYVN